MTDLQRLVFLMCLGTTAVLLACLPCCAEAQPMGLFPLDAMEAGLEAGGRSPIRLSREQILRRLSDLAMSRSGSGPGYTIPRKRQSDSGIAVRLLGGLPIDIIQLDEQLRNERNLRANMQRNLDSFDKAGRRR